jgi:hypothetical protein
MTTLLFMLPPGIWIGQLYYTMKVGIFQEEEGLFLVGALERCEGHGEKFIDAL